MTPSPSSQSHGRQKKRRRTSGERSSSSSPHDSMVEGLETSALELCSPPHAGGTPLQPPAPPSSAGSASSQPLSTHQTQVTAQGLPPPPQTHPHGPTLVPIPGDPGLMLPPISHPDDMEIKPGIAEMIREEERVSVIHSLIVELEPLHEPSFVIVMHMCINALPFVAKSLKILIFFSSQSLVKIILSQAEIITNAFPPL